MSSNGNLTSADLSPASGGIGGPDPGQGQLEHSAAAAWNALAEHCRTNNGVQIRPNGPDSLYRPYSRQVFWKNYWCGQGACGNAATPGAEVEPAFIPIVCGGRPSWPPSTNTLSSGRRSGLARWVASPENPLTARVRVNRIWQLHFGYGLV